MIVRWTVSRQGATAFKTHPAKVLLHWNSAVMDMTAVEMLDLSAYEMKMARALRPAGEKAATGGAQRIHRRSAREVGGRGSSLGEGVGSGDAVSEGSRRVGGRLSTSRPLRPPQRLESIFEARKALHSAHLRGPARASDAPAAPGRRHYFSAGRSLAVHSGPWRGRCLWKGQSAGRERRWLEEYARTVHRSTIRSRRVF